MEWIIVGWQVFTPCCGCGLGCGCGCGRLSPKAAPLHQTLFTPPLQHASISTRHSIIIIMTEIRCVSQCPLSNVQLSSACVEPMALNPPIHTSTPSTTPPTGASQCKPSLFFSSNANVHRMVACRRMGLGAGLNRAMIL